jgi:hypothetical protein
MSAAASSRLRLCLARKFLTLYLLTLLEYEDFNENDKNKIIFASIFNLEPQLKVLLM